MRYLIFALLGILLFLLFVVFILKMNLSLRINNRHICVFLWKIKIYDSEKDKKTKEQEKNYEKNYKSFKHSVNFIRRVFDDENDDIINILKQIEKTFNLKRLDISLDYGFGDAAVTGITGGAIWILITNIFSFIEKYIKIKKITNVAVTPHYTEKLIDFRLYFNISVSLFHFFISLYYIKRFLNTLKGGR